jgi:hypothetical protein
MAEVEIPKPINDTDVFSEIHDKVRGISALIMSLPDKTPDQTRTKHFALEHINFFETNEIHELRKAFE